MNVERKGSEAAQYSAVPASMQGVFKRAEGEQGVRPHQNHTPRFFEYEGYSLPSSDYMLLLDGTVVRRKP